MTGVARAVRPFFVVKRPEKTGRVYHEENIEFDWHKGMSWQVRQRSSIAMAEAIMDKYKSQAEYLRILEVSTKSTNYDLGVALSARNLLFTDTKTQRTLPVENWFQASKQFTRDGITFGPYTDLLNVEPSQAKRFVNANLDTKTAEQYRGNPLFEQVQSEIAGASMSSFVFLGDEYPLEPKSSFYDYLYAKALNQEQNDALARAIGEYTTFTDIEFNPIKSGKVIRFNTQARACAIFVALQQRDLLNDALESIDSFIECVEGGSRLAERG
jgi:hypothetical protein